MPEFDRAREFPRPEDDLAEVSTAELGPCRFAAVRPSHSFDELVADLRARMGWLPLDRFAFAPERSNEYSVRANWALYCDNYLEGFHIPYLHASLSAAVDQGYLGSLPGQFCPGANINEDAGTVLLGCGTLQANNGVSGGGRVATITFTPKDAGKSNLLFTKAELAAYLLDPTAPNGGVIPVTTGSGVIKVAGSGDSNSIEPTPTYNPTLLTPTPSGGQVPTPVDPNDPNVGEATPRANTPTPRSGTTSSGSSGSSSGGSVQGSTTSGGAGSPSSGASGSSGGATGPDGAPVAGAQCARGYRAPVRDDWNGRSVVATGARMRAPAATRRQRPRSVARPAQALPLPAPDQLLALLRIAPTGVLQRQHAVRFGRVQVAAQVDEVPLLARGKETAQLAGPVSEQLRQRRQVLGRLEQLGRDHPQRLDRRRQRQRLAVAVAQRAAVGGHGHRAQRALVAFGREEIALHHLQLEGARQHLASLCDGDHRDAANHDGQDPEGDVRD